MDTFETRTPVWRMTVSQLALQGHSLKRSSVENIVTTETSTSTVPRATACSGPVRQRRPMRVLSAKNMWN